MTDGPRVLLSKTGLAIASFWLLLGLVYSLPSPLGELLRTRSEPLLTRPTMPTVRHAPAPRHRDQPSADRSAADSTAAGASRDSEGASERRGQAGGGFEPLQGQGRALAHFAAALQRTAANEPGAVTRVAHYGDSLIDLDHITAPLRRIFQRRHGDAGHGFSPVAKPWDWYNQLGILLGRADGWVVHQVVDARIDRHLGYGLVAFENPGGARSLLVRTNPSVRFSRLELSYLQQPGSGRVEVWVDGKRLAVVATAGPRQPGYHTVSVEDGPHQIRLRALGRVRLFGLVLDRDRPGVVWDNLPLVSARFHQLARADAAHWKAQLAHRRPDLVVYQFGATDTLNYGGDLDRYGRRVGLVLERMRQALPRASCLVIGPLDRLQRIGGALRSPGVVRRVSDRQREVAIANGCAFWDRQQGMGGPGAMRRWLEQGLALKDMVHLNPKGGTELARRLDRALCAALAGLGLPRPK